MAVRSASSAVGAAADDQVTITKPSGVVDGDVLVYLIDAFSQTVAWGFTPAASGTFTTSGGAGRGTGFAWATRLASSEPANRTISIGGGNGIQLKAACVALSGRSSATPSASQATNDAGASATPISTPLAGITAAAGDDVLWLSGAASTGSSTGPITATPPTNYTSQAEEDIVGSTFSSGAVNISSRVNVTAGATGTLTGTWTQGSGHADTAGAVLAFPASGSSSATAAPSTGSLSMNGLAPSMNTFTNVRIREVLINEAGSPVANQTGIHLMVWYSGFPGGAADLSYSNMTTDPNGTTSWSLATGSLLYNQRIFYVAHDGHASLSVYTCAQMMPTYS